MAKIYAPFTPEQVEALNRWQNGPVHPFTCAFDHDGSKDLIAGEKGWFCPGCTYTQDWAHDFMLNVPVDPFEHLRNNSSPTNP